MARKQARRRPALVMETLESRCLLAGDIVTIGSPRGRIPHRRYAGDRAVAQTAYLPIGMTRHDFLAHFNTRQSSSRGEGQGHDNGNGTGNFTIVEEVEPNNTRATAQPVPLGTTFPQFDAVNVVGSATGTDSDVFRKELRAGDILGVNVDFALDLSVHDSSGRELIGTQFDTNGLISPIGSPLPNGGLVSLAYVIPRDGTYYTTVSQGLGDYTLELRAFRPILESEPIGTKQTIFLDFDGETVDMSIWGIDQTSRLSPLRDFLPNWGLTAASENAVIDSVVDYFTDLVSDYIKEFGNNGDFDATGNPGDFGVRILNSRDHADPWGLPNVSRIIIGGTIGEFGIATLGIAQSIDVGNFVTNQTGVVLLDLLSLNDPADPLFVNSINSVPRAVDFSIVDAIGRVVGAIAVHEVGHYFGNWHTNNANDVLNIMDTGGVPITVWAGVGPDGIAGTPDDRLHTWGEDEYDPFELFTGVEDTLNVMAFGLSTGGRLRDVPGSIRGTKFHDLNDNARRDGGEPGLAGFVIYADMNGNGVLDPNEPSATTRRDGSYSLNVPPGTYLIREQQRDGWRQTFPRNGEGQLVTVGLGQVVTGVDFGNTEEMVGVQGVVWQDLNGDGVRDAGEPGMANVFVWADLNGDGRVSLGEPSTHTNTQGEYSLELDPFRTYTIRAQIGPGYTQTFPADAAGHSVFVGANTLVSGRNFGVSGKRFSWGDAPAPYPVSMADNGARHGILRGFQLGPTLGIGTLDGANSGDGLGNPHHDGVEFLTPLIAGTPATIAVDVRLGGHSRGYLQGWIDFNGDGTWDSSEQIVKNARLGEGVHELTFMVPESAVAGDLVARFRYGWERNWEPTGEALAGEVEDYVVGVVGNVPQANDDAFTVTQDSADNVFDVLANDAPSSAGGLRIQSATTPTAQGGTVVVAPNGQTLSYSPAFGFFGVDSFDYTVVDDSGNTASASVFVTVTPTFSAPIAIDDQEFVGRNSSRLIDVLANDILGANPPVRINGIVSGPSHGTAVLDTAGTPDPTDDTIRYTPNTDFEGVDQFVYEIIDLAGNTSQASVTVFVGDAFADDQVRYSLGFTNTAGQSIETITVGSEFYVTIFVADVREGINPADMGVFSAWVDVLYDRNLVSIAGPLVFDGDYTAVPDGQIAIPGIIDEAGAFRMPDQLPPGPGDKLVFRARFRAEVAGEVTFLTNPADDIADPITMPGVVGDSDTLLYSPPSVVGIQQITYLGDTLTILPAGAAPTSSGSGEGENPLHNYSMANDVNGDGRVNAFDVLLLVGWLHEERQQGSANGEASEGEQAQLFLDTNNDKRVNPMDVLSVVSEIYGRTAAAQGEGEGESSLNDDFFAMSTNAALQERLSAVDPAALTSPFTRHMNDLSLIAVAEMPTTSAVIRSTLADTGSIQNNLRLRETIGLQVGPQRLIAQPGAEHAAALDGWLTEHERVYGPVAEALEADLLEDVLKGWNS
jgi:large repetitive protein